MLSRIANGLFDLGRAVERAQHVTQIIEVNHKMNLERAFDDDGEVWQAISDAFAADLVCPQERDVYERLVLSHDHPFSVRRCVGRARFEGRATREHISEEMWLHLNQTHLSFEALTFDSILAIGRSEFNRRVTIFSDAHSGLADDTMIRGEAWAFLRIGKLTERACMICRVLKIKESLITPGRVDAPIDTHQWQALLRSLSGYESYRRVYDARIIPSRVLEFVLQRENFPRSLAGCLIEIQSVMDVFSGSREQAVELDLLISHLLEDVRQAQPEQLLDDASFSTFLDQISRRCKQLSKTMDRTFFSSIRPTPKYGFEVGTIGAVVQQ